MCLQVCLKCRISQESAKEELGKVDILTITIEGPEENYSTGEVWWIPKRGKHAQTLEVLWLYQNKSCRPSWAVTERRNMTMNAVGAEVSLPGSISELHFWGSFAKEMVTFESTEAQRRWWEIGSGWSCSTKEFMCHHPPRSAWLPTFYWKLSSQCPDEVGKHLLCFYRQTKHWVNSLITLGNFLCRYPHVFSTWCWFLAGPGFTLIHQTISFSLH